MRRWLALGLVFVAGCGGESTDAPSVSDATSVDSSAQDAVAEVAEDTSVTDATSSETDASTKDAPADVPADTLGSECDGFATKPLIPPKACDKAGGLTSSEKPPNGLFSTSWFGCYRKSDGTIYKDPSDNCLFACGSMGLCASGKSGPECESDLQWFSADADRFGCGARIRVTNCKNGKRVVLAALDKGPNCPTEQKFGAPVLDMSHAAMVHLFEGKTYGGSDLQRVHVEPVPATTPLGPL